MAPAPAAPKDTPAPADTAPALSKDNEDAFVNEMLETAAELRKEKDALHEKIGANRQVLRNLKTMGKGSEEQRAAIDEWYPPVKPGRGKKNDNDAAA